MSKTLEMTVMIVMENGRVELLRQTFKPGGWTAAMKNIGTLPLIESRRVSSVTVVVETDVTTYRGNEVLEVLGWEG